MTRSVAMESIRNSDSSDADPSDGPGVPLSDAIMHEAVCRIQLPGTVNLDIPSNELAEHVLAGARIMEVNRVFCEKIAGLPRQRVEDSPIAQHVTADFQRILESFFERDAQMIERRYRVTDGDDGSTRHFDVTLTGDLRKNRPTTLVVSFLDVTDRVDLENELVTSLERQRSQLGRELHDGISQLLTGIRLLSETLVNSLPSSMNHERRFAENILTYAREATEEVSQLETDLLEGNELTERGLIESLRRIAHATDSLPDVSCTFSCSREDLQSVEDESNWQLHLYRIAQEAIHNAVRHGDPEQIEISLTYDPPRLVLSVRDDGKGLDDDQEPSHGLKTMRHRADSIGADLEIASTADRGTTVRCILSHPQK